MRLFIQLGQLGMKSCVVDCLPKAGGQCSELYPEKPIYDIPAYPVTTGNELVENLKNQIKPFNSEFLLNQRVDQVNHQNNKFISETSSGNKVSSKCIFIAAGNGAFGPNKPPLENIEEFENTSVLYNVDKKKEIKLSYNIENVENKNKDLNKVNIDSELKIITELELNQLLKTADLDKGKTFVNKNCASCHDLNMPIKNKIGPSLATILDRKIGNLSGYKYSKTFLNIDKKWNICL